MSNPFLIAALFCALGPAATRSYGQAGVKAGENLIVKEVFTADPAPLVHLNDKLGHDFALAVCPTPGLQ